MSYDPNFKHGGFHPPQAESRSLTESMDIVGEFRYLFPEQAKNPDCLLPVDDTAAVIEALKALGETMIEPTDTPPNDSNIPPVYTYWGQFIDHDVTASDFSRVAPADIIQDSFTPLAPDVVTANVFNRRRPVLDLDSLYGDGPDGAAAHLYNADGTHFIIGTCTNIGDESTPNPSLGLERDLPRDANGMAIIGDARNDENLLVAQFHTGMLRFHNAIADWVADREGLTGRDLFWRANTLVRHHYQWLVVNDYLETITMPGTVGKILYGEQRFYNPDSNAIFMPLEYAGAVYRFGHSQVRGTYDLNQNFGRPDPINNPNINFPASFAQMFTFTGGGGMSGLPTLPNNWIADWDRLCNHNSPFPDRFARRIDTNLAIFLNNLFKSVAEAEALMPLTAMQRSIVKHLAVRNLLRGYLLSLPTGQCVADAVGVARLSSAELQQGNSQAVNDALTNGGFLDRTPLWYYILKEAEIHANGNALGEVGGRIVAETQIGLLKADSNSYLNRSWNPSMGVKFANGDPITTIYDLFRFAGTAI